MDIDLTIDGMDVTVCEGPYIEGGQLTVEARRFISALIAGLPDARAVASSELLDTYNSSWSDENNPALSDEQFQGKLVKPSFHVSDEFGFATVYFNDSGMFGGQLIEVFISAGRPFSACIAG
jgi:hypothetical protein